MAAKVSNKGCYSKRFSWDPRPKVRHWLVQSCELGANCTWFRPKVHSIPYLSVQCRAHDNTAVSTDIITWTLTYCTCFRRAARISHSCGRGFESVTTAQMRFSWKAMFFEIRHVWFVPWKNRRGREMVLWVRIKRAKGQMCPSLSYHASLFYHSIVLSQRESSNSCFSNNENFLVVWSPNYAENHLKLKRALYWI